MFPTKSVNTMPNSNLTSFQELIDGVRGGDPVAVRELLQRYYPEIQRIIRIRLTDRRLRSVLDSTDIFQSVFAAFYVRVVDGQFDLSEPEKFVKLLASMVRNKIIDHARRPGNRRTVVSDEDMWSNLAGSAPSACDIIGERELLERARHSLTPIELYIAEQRAEGRSWFDLSEELEVDAEALRKRFERALLRVREELTVIRE